MDARFSVVSVDKGIEKKWKGQVFQTKIANVSGGGLLIRIPSIPGSLIESLRQEQAELRFEFKLFPEGNTIKARAILRWSGADRESVENCYLMGMEFTEISDLDQMEIMNYVEIRLIR